VIAAAEVGDAERDAELGEGVVDPFDEHSGAVARRAVSYNWSNSTWCTCQGTDEAYAASRCSWPANVDLPAPGNPHKSNTNILPQDMMIWGRA
jgi:hypothetical protein